MPHYVLVHGAWHGGWCWARVLPLLRAAGREASAVTLTGVGERAHLLNTDIRLATHVEDVLNLIRCEELDEVVLVGHSYAGMVITGVADTLGRERPGLIRHLIYVDAVVPKPGESWSSQHPAEIIKGRIEAARQCGGVAIPPPDAELFGLQGADREWVNRRQTPQPVGVYQDPLSFDIRRIAQFPRTYIDCVAPRLAVIDVMRRRVREDAGWNVVELRTGHDPMVSEPEKLVAILLAVEV